VRQKNLKAFCTLDGTIVGCMWLVWAGSLLLAMLIFAEDYHVLRLPSNFIIESNDEFVAQLQYRDGSVEIIKTTRPLRGFEKIAYYMSLGRLPKRSSEATCVLLLFAMSSQFLVLCHCRRSWSRWIAFGLAILAGIGWTWLEISFWLGGIHGDSFESKAIGDPIGLLAVPLVFFFFLVWRERKSPRFYLGLVLVQGLLIYPWFYAWGFTELMLGWIWI